MAGGLWINEFGTPAMGRAGAGAEAGVNDASAAFHNPASMIRISGQELMSTAGIIYSSIEFDVDSAGAINGTRDGGDQGGGLPGISTFYTRQLFEDWRFGVSLAALTGAALDPDDDWAGRFQMTELNLLGIAFMPAMAYRVTDRFSVGLGIPVMYTDLELKVAVPNLNDPTATEGSAKIDGDDVVAGINVSALYEPTDRTRIGFFYQSKLEADYSGDFKLSVPDANAVSVGVDTDLTFADIARIAITQEVTGRLRLHATLGWEGWSELDSVNLSTQSGGVVLPKKWDDTYKIAVGFDYDLNQRWRIQGGLAYDTDPVDNDDRTADMPIDRQIRYAMGTQYTKTNGTTISAHFVYVDLGDGKIVADPGIAGAGFVGEYSTNELYFFSVSADWQIGE
jgi:long-chain fatty acid transport protein